jgi:hypothetical protein
MSSLVQPATDLPPYFPTNALQPTDTNDDRVGQVASHALAASENAKKLWGDLSKKCQTLTGRWNLLPHDAHVKIASFLVARQLCQLLFLNRATALAVHQNHLVIDALIHRNSELSPLTYQEYRLCVFFGDIEQLKSITCLNIRNAGKNGKNIKDDELKTLFSRFEKLEVLNFSECWNISNEGFGHFVAYAKKFGPLLRVLHLESMLTFGDEKMIALLAHCGNVTDLNLSPANGITDKSLAHLGPSCPNLVRLMLRGCRFSDDNLKALVAHCPELTDLDLSITRITEDSMAVLARFSKLSKLCLARLPIFTEEGTGSLELSFPQLTELDLTFCDIEDKALQSMTSKCSHLRRLILSCCWGLTDVGITGAASNCRELTHLDLTDSSNVTDAGLQAVAMHCPHLLQLKIGGCDALTEEGIRDLGLKCEKLTHLTVDPAKVSELRFRNLTHLTYQNSEEDRNIKHVLSDCPNLTHLDLSTCYNLNKEELTHIVRSYPHLTHIVLPTSRFIKRLVDVLLLYPSLRYLDVSICREMTCEQIDSLQAANPHLKIRTRCLCE